MKNDKKQIKKEEGVVEEIAEVIEAPIIEENVDKNQEFITRIEELEAQAKRFLADYQNLQRRTQEEKGNWIQMANKDLLLKLLPIFDTLVLANNHIQSEGLTLSIKQFLQVLEQEGVTKIEAVGKPFDPQTMECITTQEGKEGVVLSEVRAGFMLRNATLRSAQVIVGKDK